MVAFREFARAYRTQLGRRDEIEATLHNRLARAFARQERVVRRRLRDISSGIITDVPLTAAADDPVPSLRASELFMDGFDETLADEMSPEFERWAEIIGVSLVGAAIFGTRRRRLNAYTRMQIAQQVARLDYVTEAATGAVEDVLATSYQSGLVFSEMAERLSGVFERLSGRSANLIARVEAVAIMGGAVTAAARLGRVPALRMWVTQEDERVRPTHEDAHGQVRELDVPFLIGDSLLDYPGDPSGPIEETANCRCFLAMLPAGVEPDEVIEDGDFDDEGEFLTRYVTLAVAANRASFEFDPDQPRDESGRWSETGGGGSANPDVPEKVLDVLGVPDVPFHSTDQREIEQWERSANAAKQHVAQDLGGRMKSSTSELLIAAGRGSEFLRDEPTVAFGDRQVLIGRDSTGKLWTVDAATRADQIEEIERTGIIEGDIPADTLFDVRRGDDPASETMFREYAADRLVNLWAGTSNDHDPIALAVQRAAEDEFGLRNAQDWEATDAGEEAARVYAENGAVYRDYVRSQYEATQQRLADAGITEVVLHRGFSWWDEENGDFTPPEWAQGVGSATMTSRPMSSWTADPDRVESFADPESQMWTTHVTATIPASQIMSTPQTGAGCLREAEFIVLGGEHEVEVVRSGFPENFETEGDEFTHVPLTADEANTRTQAVTVATRNEDWLRTLEWDLPLTLAALEGQGINIGGLLKLPAAEAMPRELRVVFGLTAAFDPDQPRDESGRWSETGADGGGGAEGGLFITRVGPDDPLSAHDPVTVQSAVHAAGRYSETAADPYRRAEDWGILADVERDPDTGEPVNIPDVWTPGTVESLSESVTVWQTDFATSRDIQTAADALLGFDPNHNYGDDDAAWAREILHAMSGNGPDGAASAFAISSDEGLTFGTVGAMDFRLGELTRGVDDPDGELLDVFQQAHESGGTVAWSMASFVVGGEMGENRVIEWASQMGDEIPTYEDPDTGELVQLDGDDAAVRTALGYVANPASGTTGQSPVLIQAEATGLVLDGGFEAVVGGKFTVAEIRDATPEERSRWIPDQPDEASGATLPADLPLTIVQLRQVENVKLPEQAAITAAAEAGPATNVFISWRDGSLRPGTPAALTAAVFEFDPDQPRDEQGRWTGDGGGGDAGIDEDGGSIAAPGAEPENVIALKGREGGAGTPDDPVYVDGDIDSAIRELASGKSIRLDEHKQASVLVQRLGTYARELRDQGEKAPDFDLCGVSVEGTNIFCHENLGVPRAQMPQLRGRAVDGSPAAELRKDPADSMERVAVEREFTSALVDAGVRFTDKRVPENMLRATQNQLNGGAAGVILGRMLDGSFIDNPDMPVWVTKDGYILDGHHRWAATVAKDLIDGKRGDELVTVREVDMEIGAALDFTRAWTRDFGMVQEDASQLRIAAAAASAIMQAMLADDRATLADLLTLRFEGMTADAVGNLAESGDPGAMLWLGYAQILALRGDQEAIAWFEFDPDQARDESGRWTDEGGGDGGDGGEAEAEGEKPATEQTDPAGTVTPSTPLPSRSQPKERGAALKDANKRAIAAGRDTESLHDRIEGQRGRYRPERAEVHRQIVRERLDAAIAAGAEQNRQSIVLAGLPGSGKTTATRELIDTSKYVVVNADDMKEELARRGLFEPPEGMGKMEAAPLIHEESSKLAKDLASMAAAEGYNIIWDMTMGDPASFTKRVGAMERLGGDYNVTGILVSVPIEQSLDSVASRYERGLASDPDMARYVTPEIIEANRDPTGQYRSTNEAAFDQVKRDMDAWIVIDNTDFETRITDSSAPDVADDLRD